MANAHPHPATGAPDLRILARGAIFIDVLLHVHSFPLEDTKTRATSTSTRRGGSAANTLCALAQLPGVASAELLCPFGEGDEARRVRDDLRDRGVGTGLCPVVQGAEGVPKAYIILSESTSSRTIINHNPLPFPSPTVIRSLFPSTPSSPPRFNWVHFEGRDPDTLLPTMQHLSRTASQGGYRRRLTLSLECEKPGRTGLEECLPEADVVFFSREWAQHAGFENPRAFLLFTALRAKRDAILFCTWGKEGAALLAPGSNDFVRASAFGNGEAVDTVGAGDVFIAGAIYALSRRLRSGQPQPEDDEPAKGRWGLEECLRFASELAGRKVVREGLDGLGEEMGQAGYFDG